MTGSTRLVVVDPLPGIYKNTTNLDADNRYIDGDKVRFRYGRPEKIGGWVEEVTDRNFTGTARSALGWKTRENRKYLAVGTECKLELFDSGSIRDITPIRSTETGSRNYTTTISSDLVDVEITAHNAQVGDFVIFDTDVTGNGITLSGELQVTAVVDTNTLTFTSSTTATSSGTFSDSTDIDLLLQCGATDNGSAFGWGVGTWNTPGATPTDGWGDPRGGSGVDVDLRIWSMDTYGEDLLACPQKGAIYFWDSSVGTGSRATQLSGAPNYNQFVMVHGGSRHVIAFGSTDLFSGDQDPLLVRWADQDDFTDWTPDPLNTAGDFIIESGTDIVAAVETKREIVVFTNSSVHSMQFIGGEFRFSLQTLSETGNIAGQNAAKDINGVVYWMGESSFYVYDGSVRALPCTLQEFYFDPASEGSLNLDQKEKATAHVNEEFNEIIWFYPSRDSLENDRYVIYNYLEDTWYDGTLERSTWFDRGVYDRPYGIDPTGQLWVHEQGKNDGANPMYSFVETSDYTLGEGDEFMFIDRIIPDATIVNQITYTIQTKRFPNGDPLVTKEPYPATSSTRQIHCRARGRTGSLKIETNITNGDYRLGKTRVSVQKDGRR